MKYTIRPVASSAPVGPVPTPMGPVGVPHAAR